MIRTHVLFAITDDDDDDYDNGDDDYDGEDISHHL